MSGAPTVIYRAANPQQAYLLKSVLEDRGIAAWVVNDAMQIAGGELPLGWTAAPQVTVGENDSVQARQIAEEFDSRTAHEPQPDEPAAAAAAAAEWEAWPVCPECGEKRAVRCTVCGASGNRFPLADIEETANGERVLLFCESCDDHFLPEFFRLCHRCGHDYGDGIGADAARGPIEFNLRTWLLAGVLLTGTVALVGYFYWLMQQP